MRVLVVVGVLLIAAGGYVFLNGGSFTSRRDLLRVGDVAISAKEQRPIEPWIAGVAIVAGVVMVGVGLKRAR
jgi:hypothetical protein